MLQNVSQEVKILSIYVFECKSVVEPRLDLYSLLVKIDHSLI